ncbi:hypothetical protein EC973_008372 [Apophysomyces ossiformis]|uniref:Nuclear speckle splicing regulatory protein 1 N-terminal domain-containing protein n=1 Tax=Apophysomyces ossiformis TaxID=679940 RepID=A0A8H7BSQ6_9FUNG|nr:hypothetical protein EC973_008372 [Apophysomyces ossiformis]
MQKMKFGLNVPAKKGPKPVLNRHNAFSHQENEENEVEENQTQQQMKTKSKSHRTMINQQLSSYTTASKKIAEEHTKAIEEDPTIFDYDAVYDDLKNAERKQKEAMKTADTKQARYIQGLLEMAEIRKRDRLLAEEKKVAREREAEGDAYADKEEFTTEAYKKQKEELERIEAEERQREEKAQKKKSMTSFYRQVLDRKEASRLAFMKAMEEKSSAPDTSAPIPARQEADLDLKLAEQARLEGKTVRLNDSNEIVDKRELLGAGLNTKPKYGSFASLASTDERIRERQKEYDEYKRKKVEEYEKRKHEGRHDERERLSREVERQMLENREKEREEQERKQKEFERKIAEKRTTDESAMSAKERYLARKRQRLEQESKESS